MSVLKLSLSDDDNPTNNFSLKKYILIVKKALSLTEPTQESTANVEWRNSLKKKEIKKNYWSY